MAESQDRLDKYQRILDTRILVKLDVQAILQSAQLESINRSVRDLALALSQGRDTVAKLLADQTLAIREHVDRRFNNQAYRDSVRRTQQQFKDSLFFPEIFARQDDISRSHEGTCRWIFGPPKIKSYLSKKKIIKYFTRNGKAPPWSSFTDWLEKGECAYW